MAFEQTNVVEQVETKKTFVERSKDFCKKHKKEIFITIVVIAGAAVGGTVLAKNKDRIAEYFKNVDCTDVVTGVVPAVSEFLPGTEINREILERKTGEMLTATKLGSLVGLSAQKINKRLIAVGLHKPYGSNLYEITEAGREFGVMTDKITSWDHPFSNGEWDRVVLEIICTPEELSKNVL